MWVSLETQSVQCSGLGSRSQGCLTQGMNWGKGDFLFQASCSLLIPTTPWFRLLFSGIVSRDANPTGISILFPSPQGTNVSPVMIPAHQLLFLISPTASLSVLFLPTGFISKTFKSPGRASRKSNKECRDVQHWPLPQVISSVLCVFL